jgi:hypothetical protein
VDLVLASDILYALPGKSVLFRELACTLKQLLCEPEHSETADERAEPGRRLAVFAYQHRSGDERQFFDEVLPSEGFTCVDVTDVAVSMGAGLSLGLGAVCSETNPGGMMRGLIRLVEVRLL